VNITKHVICLLSSVLRHLSSVLCHPSSVPRPLSLQQHFPYPLRRPPIPKRRHSKPLPSAFCYLLSVICYLSSVFRPLRLCALCERPPFPSAHHPSLISARLGTQPFPPCRQVELLVESEQHQLGQLLLKALCSCQVPQVCTTQRPFQGKTADHSPLRPKM
jgi:hypothetical protein